MKRLAEKRHGMTIRLAPEVWQRFARLAAQDRRSLSEEAAIVLERYVDEEERRRGLGPLASDGEPQ